MNKELNAIWLWLTKSAEAKNCICLITITGALTRALWPNTPEHFIRITGLGLQILGIWTVVWGISDTRAFFGQKSLFSKTLSKVREQFDSFILRYKKTLVTGVASVIENGDSASAIGDIGIYEAGDNPTIESRLEVLEKNLKLIHSRITHGQTDITDRFNKANRCFNERREIQARTKFHYLEKTRNRSNRRISYHLYRNNMAACGSHT